MIISTIIINKWKKSNKLITNFVKDITTLSQVQKHELVSIIQVPNGPAAKASLLSLLNETEAIFPTAELLMDPISDKAFGFEISIKLNAPPSPARTRMFPLIFIVCQMS